MAFKIRTEIKAGIVVLVTVAAFFWGFYFLKGKDIFKSEDIYYAIYDRVDGLTESNPVLINGLKVGLVREVRFVGDLDRRIFVSFAFPKGSLIPDSSTAEIFSLDLMGSKAIRIVLSNAKSYYSPGDTLISEIEQNIQEQVNAQILPLKAKAEDLLSSIDSVMTVIQYIFDENTRDNLSKTFTSIKRTIQNLEHTTITLDTLLQNEKTKLSRIFSNIESISLNLRNNNEQLSVILTNFSQISDSLAQSQILSTINNANSALANANSIIEKINRGEGSIGMLINNDSLYNHLESASRNLDLLLEDIRENPKRYMHFSIFDFGRTVIVDSDGNKIKKKNKKSKATSDNTIEYKIQIRSAKSPITNHKHELKGINDFEEHFIAGWYKYTTGNFTNINEAVSFNENIKQLFPGSFIVAFQNGEQVPVSTFKENI